MIVGKIIQSNAQNDYLCQVYQRDEVESPPAREDYAFGRFVRIRLDDERALVGLIYATRLFNPEFGRLGPRLSPQEDLQVFYPDYLREKATLIGIAAVGAIEADEVNQGLPRLAANTDALVETMTDDEVRAFHLDGEALRLAYAPGLLASDSAHVLPLLLNVLEHLTSLLPEQAAMLALLKDEIQWKAVVAPLGGER